MALTPHKEAIRRAGGDAGEAPAARLAAGLQGERVQLTGDARAALFAEHVARERLRR